MVMVLNLKYAGVLMDLDSTDKVKDFIIMFPNEDGTPATGI
jgi:hypothetical protein